jgi:predicted O-methyltransferase YrrM
VPLTDGPFRIPTAIAAIKRDTERLGFKMSSEPTTGALLRTLAATKPGGRFLELGTGTGLAAAWLLDGMDTTATLLSLDSDADAQSVARQHLGSDNRIELLTYDGESFLDQPHEPFGLIFADTWPGKFNHLDEALRLVKIGGMYVVDDLLPQPNWPEDHPPKVEMLIADLLGRSDFTPLTMDWSSGLMVLVRTETYQIT